MDIDDYLNLIQELAVKSISLTNGPIDFLSKESSDHSHAIEAIEFRRTLLSDRDIEEFGGYLAFGHFEDKPCDYRLAAWAFIIEVKRHGRLVQARRTCEPYNKDQPLFQSIPELFGKIRKRRANGNPDLQLINIQDVESTETPGIYSVNSQFVRQVEDLNPNLVNWTTTNFPASPTYIRLDPYVVSDSKSSLFLAESCTVPANPNWITTLDLYPAQKEYSQYDLEHRSYTDNPQEYWDYHVSGLRRLEVYARRSSADYLSMMIEELTRPDDPNGLMVGRCIHLDTHAPQGIHISKVKLEHIDLALNVYEDKDRSGRFRNSMQFGKSQSASYRTHIFRTEDVPFATIFLFGLMFFRSQELYRQWLEDLIK